MASILADNRKHSAGCERTRSCAVVHSSLMVLTAVLIFAGTWVLEIAAPSSGVDAQGSFPCKARVTGDRVRIRTGPSLNHFAFATLSVGTELVADGQNKDWIRVYLPPHQRCWVHGDYLQPAAANEAGEQFVEVTGQRVRVRCRPNVSYKEIGLVNKGQQLKITGVRDKTTKWAEVFAPFDVKVYIHKDYLELGGRVAAHEVAATVRGLKPTAADARGTAIAGPREPKGNGAKGTPEALPLPVPSRFTPRLTELYGRFEVERKKPILEWDFGAILDELESIRRTTEDLGEQESAERWEKWIKEHLLPLRDPLLEIERKKELKRRQREATARQSEGQIEKGVHVYEPGGREDKKYLATGWVVALGKQTAVDATHKLIKGNRLLYYLRASQYDLDKYVNKRVGIQGTLEELPPDKGARLVVVTSLTSLSNK